MTNETLKIKVPTGEARDKVTSLAGWGKFFTERELVEIVHRYCNTQDGSKKYRQNAAEKIKLLKAMVAADPKLQARLEGRPEPAEETDDKE